jgi:two-component system response regulator YesN
MIQVVVVEDERIFRESLIRRIEAFEDFRVVGTASNGIEGLFEIERLEPDVVFSDIRMPGMDGLIFLEQIRKDHGHIQVTLITGYTEFEYARKALQLGAFDYLLKPLEDKEILRVIKRLRHQQAEKSVEQAVSKEKEPQSLISLAKEWVSAHIDEATLDAVAEKVQMNTAAFSRKFHAEEGITFIKHLTGLRMNKAKELLCDPVLKISQISESVGYLDHRYFTEVFKKHWGMSPQEYRKAFYTDKPED